ncbi:MAG TPA: homoserine kinase [Thermomicrobiaceae bacterium]|nr:homoserine kinase [Thermomicrobiaceae bacterium]
MRFSVRVPASSANLGSGFDTLAIALGLYLTLEIEAGGDGGEPRVVGGPDLRGGADLVLAGLRVAAAAAGVEPPACTLHAISEIPVARGLGSSAAALVAGLVAGNHLLGEPLAPTALLELATTIEGHGDNVSASLFGGVTLALTTEAGVLCRQVEVAGELHAVLFIPDELGLTAEARAVLPPAVPRGDAVANLARTGLLVLALTSGAFDLLGEAMADRLHQPYRAALFPAVDPLIAAAREAGAYGACLSGAGPSVLALTAPQCARAVRDNLEAVAARRDLPGEAMLLDIAHEGVTLTAATASSARG